MTNGFFDAPNTAFPEPATEPGTGFMANGFFNVLKPAGPTSFDIVACVRRLTGAKTGHLGTLDPGAAGVLPVSSGKATKLFGFLVNKTKKYRATFTFGTETDTLDSYGSVTAKSQVIPSFEQLAQAVKAFTGIIDQIPPQYSAKSVGGVRAYELARKGGEANLASRKVAVYDFVLLRQADENTFAFDITCGAGTYIRSLARDVAAAVGSVAYMSSLIRLSSGVFSIENAVRLDRIEENWRRHILPMDYPLRELPARSIADENYEKLKNGVKIPCESFDGFERIYCKNEFFGLAACKRGQIDLEYNLHI